MNGAEPEHVFEARVAILGYQPENPGGLERIADEVRRNRKDLAAGRISPAEAERRGGLAVGGSHSLPVLPVLYSDTATEPIDVEDLQDELFASPASMFDSRRTRTTASS